jgi:hypothetical protein
MPPHFGRRHCCCGLLKSIAPHSFEEIFWAIWCILNLGGLLLLMLVCIQKSRTIHLRLLSTLASDTPVSGFYGPGSWWAWLFTLGMSHMHMARALLRTGSVALKWDFDLIAASCYTAAAAVDLALKSHEIAQLGATASNSPLLPSLAAAEYVVWVGTASSVFTLWNVLWSVLHGPVGFSHFYRTTGVAAVPVVIAFVAWVFTIRAHNAMAQMAPVFWCFSEEWKDSWHGMHFLYYPAEVALPSLELYATAGYWLCCSVVTAAVIIAVFLRQLVAGKVQRAELWFAIEAGICSLAFFLCLPLAISGVSVVMWTWIWLALWWPTYIVALIPWAGYFPATGTSVLEMDQITALLVAAIRIGRLIAKAASSANEEYELAPSLPT